jgi:hypothetical protein
VRAVHTGSVRFIRTTRRIAIAALVLAACSSDQAGGPGAASGTGPPDDVAVVADSNLPDPAIDYDSNGDPVAGPSGFAQVDANTAASAQLVQAFQTNRISEPERWATAVIDHRPYATGDPSGRAFDVLRASLADAGLDELAVEAVIASLTA